MEPEKCEGWFWATLDEMRSMPSRGQELLLPLTALLEQRTEHCRQITIGPEALTRKSDGLN